MKLLVLTAYSDRVPASRFRASAYFPYYRERGIDVHYEPFLDADETRAFVQQSAARRKLGHLLHGSLRRVALTLQAAQYDGIFVQREACMVGPAIVEWLLARTMEKPLIFDFDDAIWMTPEGQSHPFLSTLFRSPKKTNRLLQMATEVVAGSQRLATYARTFAKNVSVVPTVVSGHDWVPLPGRLDGHFVANHDVPVLGWVGTAGTAPQLQLVLPAFERLAREGHAFSLRIVGAGGRPIRVAGIACEHVQWTQENEIRDFQNIDIGLAPHFSGEWYEGKCGFKQVQYMAVGVPMVSSLVGGARDFVRHEVNALVAHTPDDWYVHLRALLHDAKLRALLARNGRARVNSELSLEVQGPIMADIVLRALARGSDLRLSRGARRHPQPLAPISPLGFLRDSQAP